MGKNLPLMVAGTPAVCALAVDDATATTAMAATAKFDFMLVFFPFYLLDDFIVWLLWYRRVLSSNTVSPTLLYVQLSRARVYVGRDGRQGRRIERRMVVINEIPSWMGQTE